MLIYICVSGPLVMQNVMEEGHCGGKLLTLGSSGRNERTEGVRDNMGPTKAHPPMTYFLQPCHS
jgi:hypothetical protein